MDQTAIVAWIGAITGVIGALTGTLALGWDAYKWWTSGPRLRLRASADMLFHAQLPGTGTLTTDPGSYLTLNVANVGDRKTTITRVVGYWYGGFWSRLIRRPTQKFIVPRIMHAARLPYVLEAGETWHGAAEQKGEIDRMLSSGALFFGVSHSGSDEPLLVRVKKTR